MCLNFYEKASFVTFLYRMAKNPKTFHGYVVYNLILEFLRPCYPAV